MNYYYSIDGEAVTGPLSLAELKDLQLSGALPPSTQVCREGEQSWHPVVGIVDEPSVPGPASGGWYYSQRGKIVGPITVEEIANLIPAEKLTRDTPLWREGTSDWVPAGGTELDKLFGPPRLMGEHVNNRDVWALAFAPIVGALLEHAVASSIGFTQPMFPFITIFLNVCLSIADYKQLKNAGHNTKGMGFMAAFLVPVYLVVRARRLKQRGGYALVWIVSLIISICIDAGYSTASQSENPTADASRLTGALVQSTPSESEPMPSELRATTNPDDEAKHLAEEKFLEVFMPGQGGFVVEETHIGADSMDTWDLLLFKDITISVTKAELSEIDAMNGVTWRGVISYEAKFMRKFEGVNSHAKYSAAYGAVTPKDWSAGCLIFKVVAEKRGGKWDADTFPGREYGYAFGGDYPKKPTLDEMHELDIAVEKEKD